jgi:hypothetical protein
LASNGNITTSANIDTYTIFNLPQTTTNVVPTIPNPTNTTAGKIIYINNTGTASFQIASSQIEPNTGRSFIWTGSAWSMMNETVGGGTQIKTKSTEQQSTTTTFANDNTLSFTIGANETIVFIYDLLVSNTASPNPDFKAAILGPSGSTCMVTMSGKEPLGAAFPQASTTDCTTPGTLGNNNILTDAFVPFQVQIQGRITAGVSGGTVNLQFAQFNLAAANPIKIMPGSVLHAYRTTGADVAEIYYTTDATIEKGQIVALTGEGVSQVSKTSKNYQSNALGIVSTKPGLVLAEADGEGKPVVVALSGRVPVKVSGINGSIKAGDFITSSNIVGVGMKATDAGQVVGQAMNDFLATSSESLGTIMLFIKNQYYDGGDEYVQSSTSTILSDGTVADRFTHLFRRAFEKITNIFLDMTLWIRNLKTEKVTTKELCIEDICLTKEQLKILIQNSVQQNGTNNMSTTTGATTSSVTTVNDATSTTTSTEPLVDPILIPEEASTTPETTTEEVVTPEQEVGTTTESSGN